MQTRHLGRTSRVVPWISPADSTRQRRGRAGLNLPSDSLDGCPETGWNFHVEGPASVLSTFPERGKPTHPCARHDEHHPVRPTAPSVDSSPAMVVLESVPGLRSRSPRDLKMQDQSGALELLSSSWRWLCLAGILVAGSLSPIGSEAAEDLFPSLKAGLAPKGYWTPIFRRHEQVPLAVRDDVFFLSSAGWARFEGTDYQAVGMHAVAEPNSNLDAMLSDLCVAREGKPFRLNWIHADVDEYPGVEVAAHCGSRGTVRGYSTYQQVAGTWNGCFRGRGDHSH